ncbi:uncharacterized protein MYCFIDRAFT_205819 [Pseudocercospora fijiensis CIRAD86]|uniref:Aminoglycoside phosphotransferase domain-containing protein n=1 Tax=Pseudocercospora fijiensis (strain CIRAD86) TaxID=383855 RepID=N1Q6D4_PSEFD|nr:uncharacterized protein MYCFIDRAFT_205819 [Pseudocercospora fijiensis CIRAD86]EME87859.1 hypothetical protein MYCFIDRAFT_205819 [Pseudocercospora fijiensis CIRAD86]
MPAHLNPCWATGAVTAVLRKISISPALTAATEHAFHYLRPRGEMDVRLLVSIRFNESRRLAERRPRFSMPALINAAAKSINREQDDVQSIRKLAEGGFNRVFELTLNDGHQIIARLPYPSTQPASLAVASEVATMDFVRSHGVPTPRIHGYALDSNNDVGAEYIVMEKIHAQRLGDVWINLSDKNRLKVLSGIVDLEARLFSIDFPATWQAATSFRPGMKGDAFERVSPHLIPNETWHQRSILRHPDLNLNNIFINSECQIVSVIDWQHSNILPLFLHAGIPNSLQNYGDPVSEELRKPELPDELYQMDEGDREKNLDLYRRRRTHFYYVGPAAEKLDMHYKAYVELEEIHGSSHTLLHSHGSSLVWAFVRPSANLRAHPSRMMSEASLLRRRLCTHALAPWEGNSIPIKADLVQAVRGWATLAPGSTCPIMFDSKEEEDTLRMDILRDVIGISTHGWVPHDGYEDAVAQAAAMKTRALEVAGDDLERGRMKRPESKSSGTSNFARLFCIDTALCETMVVMANREQPSTCLAGTGLLEKGHKPQSHVKRIAVMFAPASTSWSVITSKITQRIDDSASLPVIACQVQVPPADTMRWTEKLMQQRRILKILHKSVMASPTQPGAIEKWGSLSALLIHLTTCRAMLRHCRESLTKQNLNSEDFEGIQILPDAQVIMKSPFDGASLLATEIRNVTMFLNDAHTPQWKLYQGMKVPPHIDTKLGELNASEDVPWPDTNLDPLKTEIVAYCAEHGWDERLDQLLDASDGSTQAMLLREQFWAEAQDDRSEILASSHHIERYNKANQELRLIVPLHHNSDHLLSSQLHLPRSVLTPHRTV